VSKGVRRIVALTGEKARQAGEQGRQLDQLIVKALESPAENLAAALGEIQKVLGAGNVPLLTRRRAQAAVAELQARQKAWEKKQQSTLQSGVDSVTVAGELQAKAVALGPGKLIVGEIAGASDDQLRTIMDWLKKKNDSYGITLCSTIGPRVSFVAAVSDDLIAKGLKAGDWVRETAKAADGSGGGRPQMAQAGGKDPTKVAEALEKARSYAFSRVC
jgi:alanyl-tRNA synthetase